MNHSVAKKPPKAINYNLDTDFDAFAWLVNASFWAVNKMTRLIVNMLKWSIGFVAYVAMLAFLFALFTILFGPIGGVAFAFIILTAIVIKKLVVSS